MTFDRFYRCYPAVETHHQNSGNRVVLPASALDRISAMGNVQWPLFFAISNANPEDADVDGRPLVSHCGVLEFTAEEGTVLVPKFLMEKLHLGERSLVKVIYSSIPVAKYLKLQPHTKAFFDNVSDVKGVLEVALKRFSCVTVGDTVIVPYNGEEYALNVVEAKPENAVSIIETDCEVDFALALDDPPVSLSPSPPSKPVEKKMVLENAADSKRGSTRKFAAFSGEARRGDGVAVEAKKNGDVRTTLNESGGDARRQSKDDCSCGGMHGHGKSEEKPKFEAFSGNKFTLMDSNNQP